jgi:hypothetical protein
VRILWASLFVGFAALNVYAFASEGLLGLAAYLGRLGDWGVVATADLMLALLVGIAWTWRDARSRGISPTPFVLLTLMTGSLGLILYLAVHGGKADSDTDASLVSGQVVKSVGAD